MSQYNINASLVDQQVMGLTKKYEHFFGRFRSPEQKNGAAFVLLCMKTSLGLDTESAMELMTDGGNDFGVDGLYIGDEIDGEFTVVLFQGKYKRDLSGEALFPENGVKQAIATVSALFDPYKEITVNDQLRPGLEDIRSRVRDGLIPVIRFVLCNNGLRWNSLAEEDIQNARFPREQVSFAHFNHDSIVDVLRASKPIEETLPFKGKVIVENFNYKRVLLGKVPVLRIAELFTNHEEFLLERNIRRYLGLHSNRMNSAIYDTLCQDDKRDDFYFFNNGITIICNQFRYNALQDSDHNVQISGMQIINGGQTCKAIQQTLEERPELKTKLDNTFVLIRLYELGPDSQDFVNDITYATNSQNPVDLRDLRANDAVQQELELGLKELGITYKRKREDSASGAGVVHSSILAEAVLAIWRQSPQQAKYLRKEHFGKLYSRIFDSLNAAQALLAVNIFRFVENERKRPTLCDFKFLPYASHFIAMRLGILLLRAAGVEPSGVNHRAYPDIHRLFEEKKSDLYRQAATDIDVNLKKFYVDSEPSLQQLAATFRRGDLIESLRQ